MQQPMAKMGMAENKIKKKLFKFDFTKTGDDDAMQH